MARRGVGTRGMRVGFTCFPPCRRVSHRVPLNRRYYIYTAPKRHVGGVSGESARVIEISEHIIKH